MPDYVAPLRDMRFVIRELAPFADLTALPSFADVADALDPVLDEAAAFAADVLAPLDASGDRIGCRWHDGNVTTPPGFGAAYRRFAEAGWIGLPVDETYGGQGLPQVVLAATLEMWNAANVGFANGPLLNQGAIEAIERYGSPAQRERYLPQLVSGAWTGTMCLTEPQAGSDLAAVRTRAVPDGDAYRLFGQKIYITFGEHDWSDNIVHLVLARLPDAPAGTKGISLFAVPKFVINADGSCGERNDVLCTGIEHKLGLHANPTCTLSYGERVGALGELIGEPHRGLTAMFAMMNAARFSVGVQALGIADRAYAHAMTFARERVQSRDIADPAGPPIAIAGHPDVRRMLMMMKASIEAMRALAYVVAAESDLAAHAPDAEARRKHGAFVDFMTPVVKGWCTETSVELCSLALQVFGGMGYVEETGIAQRLRDVRITTIYEGTTGIQALDLAGRKLVRDLGETAHATLVRMRADAEALDSGSAPLSALRVQLLAGIERLADATRALGVAALRDLREAAAGSVPYLQLWGTVAGGWQLARGARIAAARIAAGEGDDFLRAKIATAHFYAEHCLSRTAWLHHTVVHGAASTLALDDAGFDAERRRTAAV